MVTLLGCNNCISNLCLGPKVIVSDDNIVDTFPDCQSEYESGVVKECLGSKTNFDPNVL